MRLKTFSAPSMTEAMAMVKEHFGDDAIIVSTQPGESGLGVRVTAAVDTPEPEFEEAFSDPFDGLEPVDAIAEALAHHSVPASLSDKLVRISEEGAVPDN